MPGCLFCSIVAGRAPADVLLRDGMVLAFRDIHPVAPTHILVIPVKHIASLEETAVEDEGLLGRMLLAGARVAREAGLSERGYRAVINTGAGAGQSVFHVHLHIIGGRPMRWPPG